MDTAEKRLELGLASNLIPPFYLRNSTFFSLEDQYIYDVTANSSNIIVSASNHTIKLYNPDTLAVGQTLSFHNDTISQIKVHKDHFLISASRDGRVALWDLRIDGRPAHVLEANKYPLVSFDVNIDQSIIAAGTELVNEDAKIFFWDFRMYKPLAEFSEMHSDDITQIQFHPIIPTQFLSGSTDGLLCTYDITQFDEDEAMTGTVNSGSSISRVGYFGPSAEYMYYLTNIETFALFSSYEGDMICNFDDVRRISQPGILQLDYMINCQYDPDSQRLFLLAGSNNGDINILHVNVNQLQLCQVLKNGHSEIVRSLYWDYKANILFSGAEDAKLCMWTNTPSFPQQRQHTIISTNRKKTFLANRHNPY